MGERRRHIIIYKEIESSVAHYPKHYNFASFRLAKSEKEGYIRLDETSIHVPGPSSNQQRNISMSDGLTETTSLVGNGKNMFLPADSPASKDDTVYGTGRAF